LLDRVKIAIQHVFKTSPRRPLPVLSSPILVLAKSCVSTGTARFFL